MRPDGSGWTADEDWRERVWRRYDEVPSLGAFAPSELDRELLMRGQVAVLLTEERSDSDERTERG